MRFFLSLFLVLALALPAMAGPNVKQVVFATMTTTQTTSAVNAVNFRHKTVVFQGYSTTVSTNPVTLSGTALVQCAPASDGPWNTCAQEDSTAISTTANTTLQWSDVSAYVRVKWTKTARGLKAWLNLSE